MKLKEIAATLLVATLALGTMVGCGSKGNDNTADSADQTGASGDITILSREDGSGTRGAFVELFGIEEKDADGNKVDMTTEDAKITNLCYDDNCCRRCKFSWIYFTGFFK